MVDPIFTDSFSFKKKKTIQQTNQSYENQSIFERPMLDCKHFKS